MTKVIDRKVCLVVDSSWCSCAGGGRSGWMWSMWDVKCQTCCLCRATCVFCVWLVWVCSCTQKWVQFDRMQCPQVRNWAIIFILMLLFYRCSMLSFKSEVWVSLWKSFVVVRAGIMRLHTSPSVKKAGVQVVINPQPVRMRDSKWSNYECQASLPDLISLISVLLKFDR